MAVGLALESTTVAGVNVPPAPPSLGVTVTPDDTYRPLGNPTVNEPEGMPTPEIDGLGMSGCSRSQSCLPE